jgi:hypothetical protein
MSKKQKSRFKYIKASAVRSHIKDVSGKRVSINFLYILDGYVGRKIVEAAQCHNGGIKTVNEEVAGYMGM